MRARHRARPGCISSHLCLSASHVEQSPHPCSPRKQDHREVWKVTVSKQLQKAKGSYGKSYSFRLGRKENIKQAKPLGNCCHSLQNIILFKAGREANPGTTAVLGHHRTLLFGTSQVCTVKWIQLLATTAVSISLCKMYPPKRVISKACQKQKSELDYFFAFPQSKRS